MSKTAFEKELYALKKECRDYRIGLELSIEKLEAKLNGDRIHPQNVNGHRMRCAPNKDSDGKD